MERVSFRSVLAALLVLVVDNFGLFVVFPFFTPLILNGSILDSQPESFDRTLYLVFLIASFPLAQTFGAPFFGHVADKIGRKPAFIITLCGETFGFLLSALALYLNVYTLLFISRLVTGFFAGNMTICLAVAADRVQDHARRGYLFSVLTALLGISFVAALSVGGFLSYKVLDPSFSTSLPFLITAGLSICNLLIILAFYKEGPHHHEEVQEHHPYLGLAFASLFLFFVGYIPTLQFFSLYLLETYKFGHLAIALTFLIVGVVWLFGNTVVIRLFQKFTNQFQLTYLSYTVLPITLAAAIYLQEFSLFLTFFLLYVVAAGFTWSGLVTNMSYLTRSENRGKFLGKVQATLTLASLVGPVLIVLPTYGSMEIGYYISAIILLIGSVLFFYYLKKLVSYYT